jgi:hypothetical protein
MMGGMDVGCAHAPIGSDRSCSALVYMPMVPIAEPSPPICTLSLDHRFCPS